MDVADNIGTTLKIQAVTVCIIGMEDMGGMGSSPVSAHAIIPSIKLAIHMPSDTANSAP